MGVEVVTFGCRLNAAESATMRVQASRAGIGEIAIVNTCAVTAEADRQGRKAIRRLARQQPGRRVVATGCAATIAPDAFAAMPEVAAVIGNAEKLKAAAWAALAGPSTDVVPHAEVAGRAGPRSTRDGRASFEAPLRGAPQDEEVGGFIQERTRHLLPVQTGCDHRCTFCVIPFGRGASRSVPVAEAIEAVRGAVESGSREVVLTGVDLTGYGADLPGPARLGSLVKAILRSVPDLDRLRLSSVDSIEADDDLLDALATEPRLMPHLHLSLQAGDDLVLKRMKRRHTRADAVAFCRHVRRLRPDIVLGADLIAGFPTETESMFRRTLDLVADCGLSHLHVFPFSARPGTPAARMPPVPHEVVKDRAARLRAAGEAAFARHLAREVGARRRVLTEHGSAGRTEGFLPVRFAGPMEAGEIVEATIVGQDGRRLLAA